MTGDLAVDDIDAVTALLRDWSPPPVETRDKLKLMAGAVRAAGLTVPPRAPAAEFQPKGGSTPTSATGAPCATTTTSPTTTSGCSWTSR